MTIGNWMVLGFVCALLFMFGFALGRDAGQEERRKNRPDRLTSALTTAYSILQLRVMIDRRELKSVNFYSDNEIDELLSTDEKLVLAIRNWMVNNKGEFE